MSDDETTTATPDTADETVDMRPDGSIVCTVAGTVHRLRRPNVPELFTLWELTESLVEKHKADNLARVTDAAEFAKALAQYRRDLVDWGDTEETAAAEDAGARKRRKVAPQPERPRTVSEVTYTIRLLRAHEEWTRTAFAMLSDHTLPDDAAVPAWFVSTTLANDWLAHWRDNPLGRSGAPTQS